MFSILVYWAFESLEVTKLFFYFSQFFIIFLHFKPWKSLEGDLFFSNIVYIWTVKSKKKISCTISNFLKGIGLFACHSSNLHFLGRNIHWRVRSFIYFTLSYRDCQSLNIQTLNDSEQKVLKSPGQELSNASWIRM